MKKHYILPSLLLGAFFVTGCSVVPDLGEETTPDSSQKQEEKQEKTTKTSSTTQADPRSQQQIQALKDMSPAGDFVWPAEKVERTLPFRLAEAELGSWMQYKITDKNETEPESALVLSYRFIGTDGDLFWIEKRLSKGKKTVLFRLLVDREGNVTQVFKQSGNGEPERVQPDFSSFSLEGIDENTEQEQQPVTINEHELSVVRGSFDDQSLDQTYRLMLSAQVPLKLRGSPHGLVRFQGENIVMKLVDFGKNGAPNVRLKQYR